MTMRCSRTATSRNRAAPNSRHAPRVARSGLTLMEVMIVVAIIAVLVSLSAPTFTRSMEQSHADVAGARLRAIWAAERLYWLENRTYSDNLSDLVSAGLVDPVFLSGGGRYTYSIVAADNVSFTAAATRTGSTRWSGQFLIDEQGDLSGTISALGETDIAPGFQ